MKNKKSKFEKLSDNTFSSKEMNNIVGGQSEVMDSKSKKPENSYQQWESYQDGKLSQTTEIRDVLDQDDNYVIAGSDKNKIYDYL